MKKENWYRQFWIFWLENYSFLFYSWWNDFKLLLTKVRTSNLTGLKSVCCQPIREQDWGWLTNGRQVTWRWSSVPGSVSSCDRLWGCEGMQYLYVSLVMFSVHFLWFLLIFRSLVDIADRHHVLPHQSPGAGLHQLHPRPFPWPGCGAFFCP